MKVQLLLCSVLFFSVFSYTNSFASDIEELRLVLSKLTGTVQEVGTGAVQPKADFVFQLSEPTQGSAISTSQFAYSSYFPLGNGDVKDYSGRVNYQNFNATYSYSNAYFNGHNCVREYDSLDGSEAYYSFGNDELRLYGFELQGETFRFSSPLKVFTKQTILNGGSVSSSASLVDLVDGYRLGIQLTSTVIIGGAESTAVGTAVTSRNVEMSFVFTVAGTIQTIDMKDVWVLAPEIGKLKIKIFDEYLNSLGELAITGGKVNDKAVSEILSTPSAEFTADDLLQFSGANVAFSDESTGNGTSWQWSFGDGSNSSERHPSHVYTEPGRYTVSLTVIGPGGTDGATKNEYVMIVPEEIDLNNDNNVSLVDLILALKNLTGEQTAFDALFDVNNDSTMGLPEVLYILLAVEHQR